MRLKPIDERVVVERYEDDTCGAIIIPEEAKKASLRGIIREIGEECHRVDVGDMVVFGRYSGFAMPIRNEEYQNCLIMNEEDILCIMKEV